MSRSSSQEGSPLQSPHAVKLYQHHAGGGLYINLYCQSLYIPTPSGKEGREGRERARTGEKGGGESGRKPINITAPSQTISTPCRGRSVDGRFYLYCQPLYIPTTSTLKSKCGIYEYYCTSYSLLKTLLVFFLRRALFLLA